MKMYLIIFILLFSIIFNVYSEGQIENERLFKVIYWQGLHNDISIYIVRCVLAKDFFLIVENASGISILKIDDKYSIIQKIVDNKRSEE